MWYYWKKYIKGFPQEKEGVCFQLWKEVSSISAHPHHDSAIVNTAYAADKGDTTNSSSGSGKINGKTYYYDQFDNSAYRTVYNQINEAAAAFNSSNQTAQYQDGGYYTAFTLSISNKDWEVIGNDGLRQVMNAVLADHPEYFWMSDSYECKASSSGELKFQLLTVECYSLYANGDSRIVYVNNFDLAVKTYAATLSENAKDYERYIWSTTPSSTKSIMQTISQAGTMITYMHTQQMVFSVRNTWKQLHTATPKHLKL